MNKTLFIITIIVSILSLLYIILSYVGVLRYCALNMKSPKSYIEKYKSADKASSSRVVISMSASEKDLFSLRPVINSLLDQTVKVDEIAINIPDSYTKIPKDLSNYTVVHKTAYNYEDAQDIIPTILREKEADTIIIVLKPDTIYGENFIEKMVSYLHKDNVVNLSHKNNSGYMKHPYVVKVGYFTDGFLDKVTDNYNSDNSENFAKILFDFLSKKELKSIDYRENFKSVRNTRNTRVKENVRERRERLLKQRPRRHKRLPTVVYDNQNDFTSFVV